MPLPHADAPRGPTMPIHRTLAIGDLLDLHLLDTRQFRDDEDVCAAPPPNIGARCAPALAERRSMLGVRQERWLQDGLRRSNARWTAIAQTVLMAPFDFERGAGESYYLSGWDGYPAARRRLLEHLVGARVRNPVVLSGDWHTQWVNDLVHDERVVATELVGTAISSDPAFTSSRSAPAVGDNPQVRYYSDRNGYTRAIVDHRRWRSEFVAVDAKRPGGRAELAATHVIEDGRPGALRATRGTARRARPHRAR
jgi:alkaline phosphatase D